MYLCCFSLVTSEIFQLTNNQLIYVSICGGRYDGYFKHKGNNPTCDLWDSQGNKKGVSVSGAFSVDILIGNESIIFEEHKTKNCCLKQFCIYSEL